MLHSFSADKWYDIRNNIMGRISNDGQFRIQPKFSLGPAIFGMVQQTAIITGKFHDRDDRTIVEAVARPSYSIVVMFYILILLLLIFGIKKDFLELTILLIVLGVMWGWVRVSQNRLRRRFEKTFTLENPVSKGSYL